MERLFIGQLAGFGRKEGDNLKSYKTRSAVSGSVVQNFGQICHSLKV
jgi:hypothetical protein